MRNMCLLVGMITLFVLALWGSKIVRPLWAKFTIVLLTSLAELFCGFLAINVQTPTIDRNAERTAIIISSNFLTPVKYRISASGENEWTKYNKPIEIEANTIVYAQAFFLGILPSERSSQDVFVAENGLLYFGSADKPENAISSIESVDYNYVDTHAGQSGNHYIGYQIKKQDIKVIGKALNGAQNEIHDFTYSPDILSKGDNVVTLSYTLAKDMEPLKKKLVVTANEPELVKLSVSQTDKIIYLDTPLRDCLTVSGVYEDGKNEQITDYFISPEELQEGKNTITITSGNNSATVEITAVDRNNVTGNEKETNNEINTANKIDSNIKYSGFLSSDKDIDYYKISFKQKGKLSLKFIHPKMDDDQIFWNVDLLSLEEKPITGLSSNGKNVETNSSTARVSAGTYYVKIYPHYFSNEKYTFTVLFETEDDSYESEPNNDLVSQSMNISLDTTYIGNLTTKDDVDYYRFTLDEKRKVWLEFSHDKMNNDATVWRNILFGDSEQTLLTVDSSGTNSNIVSGSIRLPAGNYYLRISSYDWCDLDYSFCLHTQTEGNESENEPNNDYSTATLLCLGTEVLGNLQSNEDADFYYFDLQEQSSIEMVFSHQKIDDGNIFWGMALYSQNSDGPVKNIDGSNMVSITGNSEGNASARWDDLAAGRYYLKVYSYCYNNGDYNIILYA